MKKYPLEQQLIAWEIIKWNAKRNIKALQIRINKKLGKEIYKIERRR